MNITDWDYILEAYNIEKGTNYRNIKSLLGYLYEETKSVPKIAKILGTAETTTMTKLKIYEFPIQKKGGDYLSRAPKKRAFLAIPDDKIRGMSIDKIMESVGCSETHSHYLLKQRFEDYPDCYIKREGCVKKCRL